MRREEAKRHARNARTLQDVHSHIMNRIAGPAFGDLRVYSSRNEGALFRHAGLDPTSRNLFCFKIHGNLCDGHLLGSHNRLASTSTFDIPRLDIFFPLRHSIIIVQ
jgi:hypothetical protein